MNGTGKLMMMMMIKQRKCERSVTVLRLMPPDLTDKDGKSLRAGCLGDCEDAIRI
jgi:hypothetical protein